MDLGSCFGRECTCEFLGSDPQSRGIVEELPDHLQRSCRPFLITQVGGDFLYERPLAVTHLDEAVRGQIPVRLNDGGRIDPEVTRERSHRGE